MHIHPNIHLFHLIHLYIYILYLKSNANRGKSHSSKMATMADSMPYALIILCWYSSLQVVGFYTPLNLGRPSWLPQPIQESKVTVCDFQKLSQICHTTSPCSFGMLSLGTQPTCCKETKKWKTEVIHRCSGLQPRPLPTACINQQTQEWASLQMITAQGNELSPFLQQPHLIPLVNRQAVPTK